MKKSCFDIGILQAFLDGESDAELSQNIALHIEGCDNCSLMLAEIDAENDLVFSMMSNEIDTLVPTQRLWERINTGIAEEKRQVSIWSKIAAFLGQNIFNPTGGLAVASLLIVGIFSAFIVTRQDPETDVQTAVISSPSIKNIEPAKPSVNVDLPPTQNQVDVAKAETVNYAPSRPSRSSSSPRYVKAVGGTRNLASPVTLRNAVYMPGEESMVNTISNLSRSVNERKDELMRPSARISFERNMAAVDDTIKTMRKQVKRDPNNQAARQVLYAAYQNKIDLLNSVNERSELMASLR